MPLDFNAGTMSYSKELNVAQLAVQRAAILTQRVFHEKVKGTVSKDDKSPVTIGDYGAQGLIVQAIKQNFPQDEIVGEEEASTLRQNSDLRSKVWSMVRDVRLEEPQSDAALGGPIANENDMLEFIDQGKSAGSAKGRVWALDPIDGTKGFLRGGQYAVCLALMVDAEIKVSILGCPNLPVDEKVSPSEAVATLEGERGVLFSAVQGQGATTRPLTGAAASSGKTITMRFVPDITQAVFCESVEAGHSSKGDNAAIAQKLGIASPPVQMDSQAKYGSIARGSGDLYLRLPVRKDYEEKIWDHAAGDLIVREAGGVVTDANGKGLDFSQGRTLKKNVGIVAAPRTIHAQVLNAVQEVLGIK